MTDRATAPSPAAAQTRRRRSDRLGPAAGLLVGATAAVIVVLVILVWDMLQGIYPAKEKTRAMYRAIGISHLALTPAGREARHPFPGPPGVQERYLPTLPEKAIGTLPLLDTGLIPSHEVAEP
jgi:hypothetical protein